MSNVATTVKANAKTIRAILDKVKYEIDVFQREYTWGEEQITQLLSDLESRFLSKYDERHEREKVREYPRYYLGSITINRTDGKRSIIDGQQRLTSITLLLIYLHNLQKGHSKPVKVSDLIFSEQYGQKSYNLKIEDRVECIDALYNNKEFSHSNKNESVQNIRQGYDCIKESFPKGLEGKALPYFIDWLIDNVMLVEIETYSDEDAYTIFETVNARGLPLSPTEMLKGYLLSNLDSDEDKKKLNELWKERIFKLGEYGKEGEEEDFFKEWLVAKYAKLVGPEGEGTENGDLEKIDQKFHSWVRNNKDTIGLNGAASFRDFINTQFDFFSNLYLQIYDAAVKLDYNLEHVFYVNAIQFNHDFDFPLIMSPIKVGDDEKTIRKKISIVSRFLETFIVCRLVNNSTNDSAFTDTMLSLIKEIRDKNVPDLAEILKSKINDFEEKMEGVMDLRLKQKNQIRFLLARITSHIERKCNIPSNFDDYFKIDSSKPFEIEHVWADRFEEHRDEFDQEREFEDFRSRLGALLLIQKGFNQSYGDSPYEEKLPHYYGQNMLAKTLSPQCYKNNPSFINYIRSSKLPFKAHEHFKKSDLLERQRLYQRICEEIWDPSWLDRMADE